MTRSAPGSGRAWLLAASLSLLLTLSGCDRRIPTPTPPAVPDAIPPKVGL